MDSFVANCKLTAESGSFVFAICNLVLSAGLNIAGICLLIYAMVPMTRGIYLYEYVRNYLWIYFFALCAAICLLFAVILFLGVVRRNKLFLKLYLIYGTSTIAVTSFFTLMYAILAQDFVVPLVTYFILALYGLVIFMIHRVYVNYCKNPSDHDRPIPRYLQIIKEIYTTKGQTLSETATRVFAAGNMTVAVVSFVIGICFMLYGIGSSAVQMFYRYYDRSFTGYAYIAGTYGFTVAPLFFSCISLVFAIILVNGLREKKAIQIKAYLIYGVVVEVSSVFFTVLFIAVTSGRGLAATLVSVCLCALYGGMLANIYKTYKSFNTELNNTETDEEEPAENKALNYKQNILLQTEILNEKNKEEGLPKNDDV